MPGGASRDGSAWSAHRCAARARRNRREASEVREPSRASSVVDREKHGIVQQKNSQLPTAIVGPTSKPLRVTHGSDLQLRASRDLPPGHLATSDRLPATGYRLPATE